MTRFELFYFYRYLVAGVIIRKGACIVPSLYLSMPGSFNEEEVDLDVSCLHRRIGYYEYYER